MSNVRLDGEIGFLCIRFRCRSSHTAGSLKKRMIEDCLQGVFRHKGELGAKELPGVG